MKLSYLPLLLSVSLLAACAKNSNSPALSDQGFVKATQSLNEQKYDAAVSELEGLAEKYPDSPEIKRKLMHAHAGAAGFESAKFKEQMERLAAKVEKFKGKSLQEEYEKIRRELRGATELDPTVLKKLKVYRFTGELRELMDDVPALTGPQTIHLNKALELYERMGMTPETSSADDNFRWGVLHAYRIVTTLKRITITLDDLARSPDAISKRGLEKYLVTSFDQIGSDALQAFKLLRKSYSKIRNVTDSVDKLVAKATGGRFRAELLDEGKSAGEILREFALDNREISERIVAEAEDLLQDSDLEESLRRAFANFREETPEVRYRKQRIRATVRAYFNELKASRSGELKEAEYLSKDFWEELNGAYEQVKREKRIAPLQQLLRDQRSQLRRLTEIGRMLVNDVKDSQIEAELKPHVLALRDQVDREQLRIFKEESLRVKAELEQLGQDWRPQVLELERLMEERLRAKGKTIEGLLDDELRDEYLELRRAMRQKDPALDEAAKRAKDEAKRFSGEQE